MSFKSNYKKKEKKELKKGKKKRRKSKENDDEMMYEALKHKVEVQKHVSESTNISMTSKYFAAVTVYTKHD